MPNLTTKSFTALVSDMATAIQGRAVALLDFTTGSILLAVSEAYASVVVWLESLILLLLQTTRLSSSSAGDVDTFLADFGQERIQGAAATGQVTFARFTDTAQAVIPLGYLVQTTDGTQQFKVIADTTQSAYSTSLGAYVIPSGTPSASVTVQAVAAGSSGNVAANSITVLAQALTYVDTVTNASPFTSGQDAQTDAEARTGFVNFIGSLSKATKEAIINAVESLQVGVTCVLTENYAYNGTYQPGYFYAVVDDGSGAPGSTFLSSAANAIDAVRGFTISYGVFAPVTETANVAMSATVAAGYDAVATKALAQTAVTAYIASLALGQTLYYTRLYQVAFDASPGITDITGLTINSGTSDLTATAQQRVIVGTVTVS